MYWLFMLFAVGALAVAFTTSSMLLLALGLLASLVLFVAWALGLYAARIGDARGSAAQIVDPAELRRLREQAEARKAETATAASARAPSAN